MIGVVIGQNCEQTLKPCLKSLKGCTKLYFLDGGSTDKTIEIANQYCDDIWENPFDSSKQGMSGIQKNYMLSKLLEKKHEGEWIIHLDADEVLADNGIELLNKELKISQPDVECFDILMHHLIDNLAIEDNNTKVHRTPTRIFKLTKKIFYPYGEHVCLQGMKYGNDGFLVSAPLFHLAYCGGIWDIKKRYSGQKKRLNILGAHDEDFLNSWLRSHLFNLYPKRHFDFRKIPRVLLEEFDIEKDELYFLNRGLEVKHFEEAIKWKEFFKPQNVLEVGCGLGPRVYAMNQIGLQAHGIELSQYAVDKSLELTNITQGDILELPYKEEFDLVIAYDLLEHIEYNNLDLAINNLIKATTEHILISVPVLGDPNLNADPTHKIRESKEWWIKQFSNKNLKLIKAPDDFLYSNQIMIFKKGGIK